MPAALIKRLLCARYYDIRCNDIRQLLAGFKAGDVSITDIRPFGLEPPWRM